LRESERVRERGRRQEGGRWGGGERGHDQRARARSTSTGTHSHEREGMDRGNEQEGDRQGQGQFTEERMVNPGTREGRRLQARTPRGGWTCAGEEELARLQKRFSAYGLPFRGDGEGRGK
jgi:hypothetical protein